LCGPAFLSLSDRAGQRLRQRRDYFIERHRIKSFALFFKALVEAQARTDEQIRLLIDRTGAKKSGSGKWTMFGKHEACGT
jgi:hypothetical protein